MSTLKADTIQSTGGGAATLTKQHAAKAYCSIDGDTTVNESLNIASTTDSTKKKENGKRNTEEERQTLSRFRVHPAQTIAPLI